MISVERIDVSGLANALYGMRLPLNSNHKSDSYCHIYDRESGGIDIVPINNVTSNTKVISTKIGEKDMSLARKLVCAGDTHAKWMRQVQISMLIRASMTFFWDLDTYKVATTKNSSSRMHKMMSRALNPEDFAWDDEDGVIQLTPFRETTLQHLNGLIEEYNELSKKGRLSDEDVKRKEAIFREVINDLPDGFMFNAVYTMSAQTARHIYFDRRNHKQLELRQFARMLPDIPEIGYFISLEGEQDNE